MIEKSETFLLKLFKERCLFFKADGKDKGDYFSDKLFLEKTKQKKLPALKHTPVKSFRNVKLLPFFENIISVFYRR